MACSLFAVGIAVTTSCTQQGAKPQVQVAPTCKPLSSFGYSDKELLDCKHMANLGSTDAAFKVGEYLLDRGKASEALVWLEMAAERGHSTSLLRLFDIYRIGGAIPKNITKSEAYLAKAVAQDSQWAVLLDARRKESTDQNRSLAIYIDLARRGNCYAQAKLARSYFKGEIVGQNLTQSYFWTLLAISGSNRKSEYHYSTNLLHDRSYEREYSLERMLARNAGISECENFRHMLPSLETTLPAESLRIAQTAATDWRIGQSEPMLPPPVGVSLQGTCIGSECLAQIVAPPKVQNTKVVPKLHVQAVDMGGDIKPSAMLPPPRIETATSVTTDDAIALITGRVISASGAAILMIDGVPVPVSSDGRFRIDKPVSVGETKLKLVAMDAMGQRSEAVATVTRTTPAETGPSYPPPVPTAVKGIRNGDAVALIVGIEGYESAPKAAYAEQDARVFYDYAVNVLGIPADNVKLLVGKGARRLDIEKTLATWVPPRVSSGKTDVVVFFAGHGLASDDGKELFLLPHDGDRDVLAESAVRRSRIVDGLKGAGVRHVTLLLDTCYSGSTREGEALLANARPVALVAKEGDLPDGVTMISAAQGDQISLSLKEAGHGLFSYTLMKGLEGAADVDGDRKITASELHAFVSDRVAREASRAGRRQTPMLVGDGGQVLARW